jgi:cell wall-associated NlpC family hydrolase
MTVRLVTPVAIGLVASALAGCAGVPQQSPPSVKPAAGAPRKHAPIAPQAQGDAAARAAQHAAKLVGAPYRYGGSNPSTGFDCSGLIQYSFSQAGLTIPRSTAEQRRASLRVSDPRQGDLLFFDQEGKKNSHAGIYLGDGYFVHAPSSGKRVRMDRLDSPYWRRHLSEIRRIGA